MITINMLSAAHKVKGQGVASACSEQIRLVSGGLADKYCVKINSFKHCDIMHYHTINPGYYLTIPLDRNRCIKVGYVHFLPETVDESINLPRPLRKAFYRYIISFYQNMDYLVTVNPFYIGELARYGINPEKVTYIPNFVSEDQFFVQPAKTIAETKERLGLPKNGFVVLGAGQVQTRKGVIDFVEVAKTMPEVTFIWAGGFSFGVITEGYKELKEIMENPPANVKFLGIIDRSEMNQLFNVADVLFQPSFSELFPMTILEAMCCGKPILLRDLDIYHDILFDFYLRGNNPKEFTELLRSLQNDKDFYSNWQQKSWEGHHFYSRSNVLSMWENFYDGICSSLEFVH